MQAKLSSLFRDPALRAAFERTERAQGRAFTVPGDAGDQAPVETSRPRVLQGGAAERLREMEPA